MENDAFCMDKLNPNMSLRLYAGGAHTYYAGGQPQKAVEMLEQYVDVCVNGFFPCALHGDSFFDSIDAWLSDLDLGTSAPRSEKVIKESMLKDVLLNPVFSALKGEAGYERAVQKLRKFVE